MTPFQAFREWSRRGPTEERISAFVAAVVAVGLFAWLLVPGDSGSTEVDATAIGATGDAATETSTTVPSGGAPTEAAGPTDATGASTGTPSGSTAAASGAVGSAPTAAASSSGGCVPTPGSDPGVTAKEIKLAITLVNLAGAAANNTFGLPSVEEQRADFEQVAASINASGGVACRKLVLQFYAANPLDQSDLQKKCLDVAESGAFAVIDAGAYFTNAAIAACFPTNKIPFFSSGPQPNAAMQRFYPYLFARSSVDLIFRNAVFALRDRGFFDPAKGMRKLGYIHRDCSPDIVKSYEGWLREAGVTDAQIVNYSVGCPGSFSSPSTLAQAILKFQQSGVTHVTFADFGPDFATFTKIAQQQRFNPKYGFGDEAIIATSESPAHGDFDNMVDAIAITVEQQGQPRSPGVPPSPATAKCNAIYKAHGRGDNVAVTPSGFGGAVCNALWIFAAAVNHAPAVQRTALVPGLQAAKSVEMSFPNGPNNFTKPRVTHGGQFWRPVQFMAECDCWRVVDATFRPSY